MIEKFSGAVIGIMNVAPRYTSSHCIFQRRALVARNIPVSLKLILDEAVKMINFIKT